MPTTGTVAAAAALEGPGAGAATSVEAKAMVREAAATTATMAAEAKFFISMMKRGGKRELRERPVAEEQEGNFPFYLFIFIWVLLVSSN